MTAVLKGGKPGPRIALPADMDALPATEQTGLPHASAAPVSRIGTRMNIQRFVRPLIVAVAVAAALAAGKKREEPATPPRPKNPSPP